MTMNIQELKKHIKETKWYRQGGAISLFYVFGPYHCINNTIGNDRNLIYQEGEFNAAFFDRELEKKKSEWVLKKQYQDKKFIDGWIAEWQKRNDRALKYLFDNFKQPVAEWTDKKLDVFLKKFNKLWLRAWDKGVMLEWFDPDGNVTFENEVKKFNVNLSKDEQDKLVSPEKPTYVQEELFSRVDIIAKMLQGKNVNNLIRKHAEQFHWYKNTWASVHEFDEKYFKKSFIKDAGNFKKLEKEVLGIRKNLKEIRSKKQAIIKAKKIPQKLSNIFHLFTQMSDWRDKRKKESMCIVNHYLYQIAKRLAKNNNAAESLVLQATHSEITKWKITKQMLGIFEKRNQGALHYGDTKKGLYWIYGKQAADVYGLLLDQIKKKEISGAIANRGKAIGRAKIVETKNDFKKFKKGDILIATMTRPEYVSIMKIASAIVTNEGGITCHAAIISRELNLPCIIGTQFATEVLKDGDLVEVDAERGVIKILKRA
jgi:phosphohistidine swiveling domain-containing protein